MLSKSRIMRGLQCHKSLWLYQHERDLAEISAGQEAIFQAGTDNGLLAQQKFPNGIDATAGNDYPNKACYEKTLELINLGQEVIYEATFIFDEVLVAIDILVKDGDAWHIYEVKSSTSAKPQHIPDAAVQKHVAEGCGIKVKDVFITHFNNKYFRYGDLDVQKLFTSTKITDSVALAFENLSATIEELKQVQNQEVCPTIAIGDHCSSPYPCDFISHCWRNEPYYNISELSRGGSKIKQLLEMGITDLKDVPEDFQLTRNQKIQVQAEKKDEERIDKKMINEFLKKLTYPLYFLDFETIMPAVPPFDGTKPYGQSVFQYSIHVQENENSEITHYEYLAPTEGKDFREDLVLKMLADCGEEGSILVYNQTFEKARIIELANIFPKYKAALLNLNKRVKDLAQPFSKMAYYNKAMQGRYSIKKVLPALVPELNYNDLEIGDGSTASNTFFAMFENRFSGDIEKTKQDLLAYCKMDTYAMVVLLKKLKAAIK